MVLGTLGIIVDVDMPDALSPVAGDEVEVEAVTSVVTYQKCTRRKA